MQRVLDPVLLRDVMTDTFVTLPESMSAAEAEQALQSAGRSYGIISDAAGAPKAVVTADRLEQIEAEDGENTTPVTLAESASLLPQALYVSDDLLVAEVLNWPHLATLTDPDSALICLSDKKPVGIITRTTLYQQQVDEVFDSFSRGYEMLLPGLPDSQPIEIVCTVCQTTNRVARYDRTTFCSNDGLPYGLHHLKQP